MASRRAALQTGGGRRHHRLQLRHVREPRRVASALGGAPGQLGAELHRHAGGSKAFVDGLRASGAAEGEAGEAAVEEGGGGGGGGGGGNG